MKGCNGTWRPSSGLSANVFGYAEALGVRVLTASVLSASRARGIFQRGAERLKERDSFHKRFFSLLILIINLIRSFKFFRILLISFNKRAL